MKKRITSILLILMMCLAMMPAGVFADDTNTDASTDTAGTEYSEDQDVQDAAGEEDPTDVTDPADGQEDVTEDPTEPSGEIILEPEEESQEVVEETEDPLPLAPSTESEAAVLEESVEAPMLMTTSPSTTTTSRKQKYVSQNGYDLRFTDRYTLVDDPLPSKAAPAHSWITGQASSMKISWSKSNWPSLIDGYIVLRKTGNESRYVEVVRLNKERDSYVDTAANKKNTSYKYTIVAYKKTGNYNRISPCSSWSAGQTTKSKLKNSYKATLNKTNITLQVGENFNLTLKHASPSTTFMKSSVRWLTEDASIVKVKDGKYTCVKPGTVKIKGRVASGRDFACTVTVIGSYKPGTPTIDVDYATTSKIDFSWEKVKYATSYDIYCDDNADHKYQKIANTTNTSYSHTGLTNGHQYKYYIKARHNNRGYIRYGEMSNVITQKAVKTPRKTRIKGYSTAVSPKSRTNYSVTVQITAPYGRTLTVQKYENKKWITKAKQTLPNGIGTKSVKVAFPNFWWPLDSSKWRIRIKAWNGEVSECISDTITITPKRYYQNPAKYVQISNKISKHGLKYYTAPVLVNNASTKKEHIDALIKTARKYLGDPYVVCQSGAPGKGVDCSGLVMQACYGAGVDLWPCNPYRHKSPAYEYESRNIAKLKTLKTVAYKNRQRGDLIFYSDGTGQIIHVAIYLGNNQIIHASLNGVVITGMSYEYGTVSLVKRIFN